MRRFLAVAVGSLGLGALLRRRRRLRAPELESSPAHELRERLAESRAAEAEQAAVPAQPEDDVAERRRAVHERTRGSIDELSS